MVEHLTSMHKEWVRFPGLYKKWKREEGRREGEDRMLYFGSCCFDKTLTKTSLKKKELIGFKTTVHH